MSDSQLTVTSIEELFELFTKAAMKARDYAPRKNPLTVTVTLRPETVEILHVISCRIGTTRANVASHIVEMGVSAAARGCGFTLDENGVIPDEQKKWDTSPKIMGISHIPEKEED